jgi:hypothetical protein
MFRERLARPEWSSGNDIGHDCFAVDVFRLCCESASIGHESRLSFEGGFVSNANFGVLRPIRLATFRGEVRIVNDVADTTSASTPGPTRARSCSNSLSSVADRGVYYLPRF